MKRGLEEVLFTYQALHYSLLEDEKDEFSRKFDSFGR